MHSRSLISAFNIRSQECIFKPKFLACLCSSAGYKIGRKPRERLSHYYDVARMSASVLVHELEVRSLYHFYKHVLISHHIASNPKAFGFGAIKVI